MKIARSIPTVSEQIVAFADLSDFHHQICLQLSAEQTFDFLSEYYSTAQRAMKGFEGKIIKMIGDALLLLLPAASPNDAVDVLRRLKSAVDEFLFQAGYDSRVCIKAHIGEVAAGLIGIEELQRFDVCGVTVNQAALLPKGEWVLSDTLQKRIRAA